jgi:3',5'-cyclic AMP phosphodiesterase CpdA
MYRVLQISDIHFGAHHAFRQHGVPREARRFDEAILLGLEENDIAASADALLVTGDLLTHQLPEEASEARLQLENLRDALGPELLGLVPGNHDVSWEAEPNDKLHIYDRLVAELQATGSSNDMPIVQVIDRPPLKSLAIALLDSCRIEGKIQKGLGCVGELQLDTLVRKLGEAGVSAATHTILLVLHHHLLPAGAVPVLPDNKNPQEDTERLKISATVDASQLLTRAGELGVAGILHGHQHIGSAVTYKRIQWNRAPLHIVAAGSAGAEAPNLRRQFWVWEIEDDKAKVISLIQRDEDAGRFVRDLEATAELSFS